MAWTALLSTILNLLKLIFAQVALRQQKQILESGASAGRTAALKEVLDETINLIAQAEMARRVFRDALRDHPERLSDNDGFKRPHPTAATDGRDSKPG